MARRRQFVIGVLLSALLCLGLWRLFHWPVHIAPEEAQQLVRVWLAVDYREAGQDPNLRAPNDPHATPSASPEETDAIEFVEFDLVRPFVKPRDADSAALARAEIDHGGGPPPDGEPVRFFLIAHRRDGAWQVRREISESAYRWRLGW